MLVSSELCQTILAEWTEGIKVKCYKCFTYHYLYFLPLHVNTTMLEHTVVDLEYSTWRLYFITLFKRVKTKCSSENINKKKHMIETKQVCGWSQSSHTNYLSLSTFLPIQPATIGVRATVGGNLIGDAALWAAYAKANVPTLSPVSSVEIPT